jgi:hypothetical protein
MTFAYHQTLRATISLGIFDRGNPHPILFRDPPYRLPSALWHNLEL